MMKNYVFGKRIFAENVQVSNNMRETGSNNNDLIIGSSRSGKTGGYIYNMLLNPSESYVVSDTKGQLSKMFGPYLESLGYKVLLLDFVNPGNGNGYNPLMYVRRHKNGRIYERDIKKIATFMTPSLDSKDPYWEKAACRYIILLMGYVLESLPLIEQNLYSVVKMHRVVQEGIGMDIINDWCKEHPNTFTAGKYNEVVPLKTAEKTWACVMDFASEILEPFGYAEYKSIFAGKNCVDIKAIGREKTVLFINVSDNDTSFHCIANVFNIQLLQALIEEADSHDDGRLDVPVRIILDDFAAGPAISDFDNIISVIASREISVSIIIQSISQLYSKFTPDKAKTIINNCDHILYLAGHDLDTADFIGEYINKTRNTVLNMPKNMQVLIADGHDAMIVPKLVPYKDSEKLDKFRADSQDKVPERDEDNSSENEDSEIIKESLAIVIARAKGQLDMDEDEKEDLYQAIDDIYHKTEMLNKFYEQNNEYDDEYDDDFDYFEDDDEYEEDDDYYNDCDEDDDCISDECNASDKQIKAKKNSD